MTYNHPNPVGQNWHEAYAGWWMGVLTINHFIIILLKKFLQHKLKTGLIYVRADSTHRIMCAASPSHLLLWSDYEFSIKTTHI